MKKIFIILPLLFVLLSLLAGIASAHVVVNPQNAIKGTFQEFTVRVPNEKDIPTVKVELDVPAAVDISQFNPVPGWKYDSTKDSSGKITKITWISTGDGIAASQFEKFTIAGLISQNATAIDWKAHQTYKDGSVVDWVGNDTSDTPAPVTKVTPVPDNVTVSDDGDITYKDSTQTSTASTSYLPLYISIAAGVLGLLSLIISFQKARK
jgi:uncharacterized protein YcnI